MLTTSSRLSLALALACGVMFNSCATTGTTGSAKSGHQLVQSAQDSKSDVMAQKTSATKATTPPKPIPQAVSGSGQRIEPPAIRNYEALEAWAFEEVDLDGTGDVETGLACYDSSSDTLYVWWNDTMDLGGNGDLETFDGFFWISDASVGIILDLRVGTDEEVVACVSQASGWSGIIVAASDGTSEVMALEGSYTR